jgi:hypothetical protein
LTEVGGWEEGGEGRCGSCKSAWLVNISSILPDPRLFKPGGLCSELRYPRPRSRERWFWCTYTPTSHFPLLNPSRSPSYLPATTSSTSPQPIHLFPPFLPTVFCFRVYRCTHTKHFPSPSPPLIRPLILSPKSAPTPPFFPALPRLLSISSSSQKTCPPTPSESTYTALAVSASSKALQLSGKKN